MMKELDSEIYTLIREVNAKIHSSIQELLGPTGITPAQAMLLTMIAENEMISLGNLADEAKMTYSNCSVICQRLERAKYITRIRDLQDQRVVNLMLTEKGMEIKVILDQKLQGLGNQLLLETNEEEKEKIYEGLVLLNRYIK